MRKHVVTLALVLGACGDATIGSTNPDAPLAIVVDARAFPDVFTPCNLPAAPPCPDGTRCLNGTCQTDECLAVVGDGGTVCPGGETCNIACVPLSDPCNGITCEAQQTCINGRCVAGCFSPSKCLNKTCDPGQFCSNGTCIDITPCESTCPTGTACNIFCRPLGPCEGVQCAESEICAVVGGVGTCVTNLCFNKTCAPTFICSNGECIPTCDCDPPCKAFEQCINNQCVCKPDCTGKPCGASDGCAGFCDNETCPTGQTCNGTACVCAPDCSGAVNCGDPDGCGGKCNGSCSTDDPQKVCQNGTCVCNTLTCGNGDCCTAGQTCFNNACCTRTCAGKHCGDDDGCGGKCDVEDCASGQTCDNTTRMCVCRTALCGGAGGTCCPTGQVCDPTNNTCCTRNCNSTDTACNDAELSCGTVCNGCPSNQVCDQATDMCKCSFVTCNGTCCANGQQCRTDTDPDRCCNPSCAGKTCGQLNDCGQECTNCPANETCNTTTDSCECPTARCGTVCCAAGSTCKGGVCCPAARTCPDEDKCCGANQTCFEDKNDVDTCCIPTRWCNDSKKCCDDPAKPICFNDGDGMDNDVCCSSGGSICNGECCPAGKTCVSNQCVSACDPPCGCLEYCNNGTCEALQCDPQDVCGCNCCNQPGQVCRPDLGFICGPVP